MIDITGLDYAIVLAFFQAQYYDVPPILEKMASSHAEAIDPFKALSRVQASLSERAKALAVGLDAASVEVELLKILKRSD